jgi:hypothetical protein
VEITACGIRQEGAVRPSERAKKLSRKRTPPPIPLAAACAGTDGDLSFGALPALPP